MKKPANLFLDQNMGKTLFFAALLFALQLSAHAQEVRNYHISFDDPPNAPAPGTGVYVSGYGEDGMVFLPLPRSAGFARFGGGVALAPDSGTPFIQGTLGDSLRMEFLDGTEFSLISLDLAAYSTRVPPRLVQFVGYRRDGSQAYAEVLVDDINFRTISFSSEFSALSHVEIPVDSWSLDNVIVQVPEPSVTCLIVAGFALLLLRTKTFDSKHRLRAR